MSGNHGRSVPIRLTTRDQAKLSAILSRLSSPNEHERAVAGLLATAFVAKHDLTWADLPPLLKPVGGPIPQATATQRPHDRRRSGTGWLGYCRRRRTGTGQTLNMLT